MQSRYSSEEDKELDLELKKLQTKAKSLILNDYYDHVNISELQHSILQQITNASTHYDVNVHLWNTGLMHKTLDDISEKVKKAKKKKHF